MTPEQQRIAIAEWCGIVCKSCNNTGFLKKFGQEEYASIRASQPHWVKVWPDKEPDIKCDHNSLPDYLNDLNAMHEAEGRLRDETVQAYEAHLNAVIACGCHVCDFSLYASDKLWHATATQRAEALLKTIGKWTDTKKG